jgi:hypothetical protein
MPLYSIPRRSFVPQSKDQTPVNWRRGLFRVWLLITVAWVMSWVLYLIVDEIRTGFRGSDMMTVPVLLIGPPVALLIFGMATGWAFRGFKSVDEPAKD